jgi:Protein of unknown function (DUF2442)
METTFPGIKAVEPLPARRLRVTFTNDIVKIYDCNHLLGEEPFRPLRDEAFFRCVRVERNGYAVIWSDRIDLAESELWLHGELPGSRLQRVAAGGVADA